MSGVLLGVVIEKALGGVWSSRWWVVCGLSGESGAALSDVARRRIARRGQEYCLQPQSASHNVTCYAVMFVHSRSIRRIFDYFEITTVMIQSR